MKRKKSYGRVFVQEHPAGKSVSMCSWRGGAEHSGRHTSCALSQVHTSGSNKCELHGSISAMAVFQNSTFLWHFYGVLWNVILLCFKILAAHLFNVHSKWQCQSPSRVVIKAKGAFIVDLEPRSQRAEGGIKGAGGQSCQETGTLTIERPFMDPSKARSTQSSHHLEDIV